MSWPAAAASRGSKTPGASTISSTMAAAASRALRGVSATTAAIGWPMKCTSPSASSGSSRTIPPIWLSPGISAAVKRHATPSIPAAAEVSRREMRPCATGDASTATCRHPGGSGRSPTKRDSPRVCGPISWLLTRGPPRTARHRPGRAPGSARARVGRGADVCIPPSRERR